MTLLHLALAFVNSFIKKDVLQEHKRVGGIVKRYCNG